MPVLQMDHGYPGSQYTYPKAERGEYERGINGLLRVQVRSLCI